MTANTPNDLSTRQIWQSALAELQSMLPRTAFENWIRPSTLVTLDDGVATLRAANTFSATTIESRHAADIEQVLGRVTGRPVRLTVTSGQAAREPAREPKGDGAPPLPELPPSRQLPLGADTGLNPRHLFDNYIVGSSNRFAHAASLSVAEQPGTKYNPLYIWGGVGLGKTHLLHAIGHRCLVRDRRLSIVYVSSETFTNDMINSLRTQRMEDFRERYRKIDVLMIDDIQFIGGKESTQEEFFHTFNALHQSGKQVIISSDKPPKAIAGIEERLRSRFEGGLIADVQLPDYEMRTAILRAKAEELRVSLPPDVVEYVAQRDQSNIRELEGALNKILAYAALTGQTMSLQLAMEALTDARSGRRDAITPAEILETVAAQFRVKVEDLQGRKRTKEVVNPRQIAMFLVRELTPASLVEIGAALGGRDHTTVMHGIDKVGRDLETDAALRAQVVSLRETLLVGAPRS